MAMPPRRIPSAGVRPVAGTNAVPLRANAATFIPSGDFAVAAPAGGRPGRHDGPVAGGAVAAGVVAAIEEWRPHRGPLLHGVQGLPVLPGFPERTTDVPCYLMGDGRVAGPRAGRAIVASNRG